MVSVNNDFGKLVIYFFFLSGQFVFIYKPNKNGSLETSFY